MQLREHVKKGKFILQGISSYLPDSFASLLPAHQHQFQGLGQRPFSGTKNVARAYYSVWMRMLVTMSESGYLNHKNLGVVGEIGPGDSLTTGLAAILSGAHTYVCLDIVPTARNYDNLAIFEELVLLFKNKTPIPNKEEEPKQRPYLTSYEFPSHVLNDDRLKELLDPKRLDMIRDAIRRFTNNEPQTGAIKIFLDVPWQEEENLKRHEGTIDLIVSNAAMEHVADVPLTYKNAKRLLKAGGIISSTIDYKCHDTAGLWNGHWTYSMPIWKLVCGKTTYLINRWSHRMHKDELLKQGYTILTDIPYTRSNQLSPSNIASPFSTYPFADFEVSEGYIAALKK